MSKIAVRNNLVAEHAGAESPLYPLIAAKIGRQAQAFPAGGILWPAAWWGLDRSATFNRLPQDMQRAALSLLGRGLLNEAYFIEKSGLAYTAKMVLLAPDTDVAQLYALIGADEATHLAWIEPFVPVEDKTRPLGPFLSFLSSLIEQCAPRVLVYLVQVILEGWGIDHYRRLADGCLDPALAGIFRRILKDEALHHRSGILQHDAGLSGEGLEEALRTYAEMVRVGAQGALGTIDAAAGGLAAEDLRDLMTALGHEAETTRKLALLKSLMLQPGMEMVVAALEAEGLFKPLSVTQAVELYLSRRRDIPAGGGQATGR
jgi:hypothetical protein